MSERTIFDVKFRVVTEGIVRIKATSAEQASVWLETQLSPQVVATEFGEPQSFEILGVDVSAPRPEPTGNDHEGDDFEYIAIF